MTPTIGKADADRPKPGLKGIDPDSGLSSPSITSKARPVNKSCASRILSPSAESLACPRSSHNRDCTKIRPVEKSLSPLLGIVTPNEKQQPRTFGLDPDAHAHMWCRSQAEEVPAFGHEPLPAIASSVHHAISSRRSRASSFAHPSSTVARGVSNLTLARGGVITAGVEYSVGKCGPAGKVTEVSPEGNHKHNPRHQETASPGSDKATVSQRYWLLPCITEQELWLDDGKPQERPVTQPVLPSILTSTCTVAVNQNMSKLLVKSSSSASLNCMHQHSKSETDGCPAALPTLDRISANETTKQRSGVTATPGTTYERNKDNSVAPSEHVPSSLTERAGSVETPMSRGSNCRNGQSSRLLGPAIPLDDQNARGEFHSRCGPYFSKSQKRQEANTIPAYLFRDDSMEGNCHSSQGRRFSAPQIRIVRADMTTILDASLDLFSYRWSSELLDDACLERSPSTPGTVLLRTTTTYRAEDDSRLRADSNVTEDSADGDDGFAAEETASIAAHRAGHRPAESRERQHPQGVSRPLAKQQFLPLADDSLLFGPMTHEGTRRNSFSGPVTPISSGCSTTAAAMRAAKQSRAPLVDVTAAGDATGTIATVDATRSSGMLRAPLRDPLTRLRIAGGARLESSSAAPADESSRFSSCARLPSATLGETPLVSQQSSYRDTSRAIGPRRPVAAETPKREKAASSSMVTGASASGRFDRRIWSEPSAGFRSKAHPPTSGTPSIFDRRHAETIDAIVLETRAARALNSAWKREQKWFFLPSFNSDNTARDTVE